MPLFQFKPAEESFLKICRNMRKKFRVIILCEGIDDTKRLKELVEKMNITFRGKVGITECEGYQTIREIAGYVASLARSSRTLRKIVIIVDANRDSAKKRVRAIETSLITHQIAITNSQMLSESIYRLQYGKIAILVKVVGLSDLPFTDHMMEDYLVKILITSGQIQEKELEGFENAKDFLEHNDIQADTIIGQAETLKVQQAFKNILNLLNLI